MYINARNAVGKKELRGNDMLDDDQLKKEVDLISKAKYPKVKIVGKIVQVYNTKERVWIKYDEELGTYFGEQRIAFEGIPKVRTFSIRNLSRNKRKTTRRTK